MFVKSKDYSRMINTRHIIQFKNTKAGVYAILHDEQVLLNDDWYDLQIALEVDGVVPALPGYELLGFHFDMRDDADKGWIQQEPVLAWRIFVNTAHAITNDTDLQSTTIRRPDGTITNPYDRDWPDIAAWARAQREQLEESRSRKKSAAHGG
jgi:hypothetical protein